MQEKRITRSSYGGAKPAQDFPLLARAYLDGGLKLDEMISARISLEAINEGFAALKRGETVRSVVMFGPRMKVYEGGRSLDGAVVTVDGAPLDPRFDMHRFSRMGFEWTYEGDGPRQLALALLVRSSGRPAARAGTDRGFHAQGCGRAGQCVAADERGYRRGVVKGHLSVAGSDPSRYPHPQGEWECVRGQRLSRRPVRCSLPPMRDATSLPPRSGCRTSAGHRLRCPRRFSASDAAAHVIPPAPAR